ncbi:unnamed protein product [Blepharisma stoltei]|uniref:Thioredoxin domain-containing protein n=1 Tax=Blepharisma stoltei TaxID=1481888 RepID=A0AAU9JK37_9CILI|nr:unnamed protein product [Blepharisma stoltei]
MKIWVGLLLTFVLGSIEKGFHDVSIDLTDENFEHETQASTGATTGDWLVLFYRPSCCGKFLDEWKILAEKVKKDQDLTVNIAKVNSVENTELLKRFEISEFPTFLLFRQGVVYNIVRKENEDFFLNMLKTQSYKEFPHKPVPQPISFVEKASEYMSQLPIYYHSVWAVPLLAIFWCFLQPSKAEATKPESPDRSSSPKRHRE